MFDESTNPFIDLDLCFDELSEAYIFFSDCDPEAQAMVASALDKKYSLMQILFNVR